MIEQIHLHPEDASRQKFRNELKYLCSEADLQLLQSRVEVLCQPDSHAGPLGTYHIRSVYFDDFCNHYYYENEDGIDPREKFRIRIYDGSSSRITLECKKKEKGMTRKESCPLTLEQYHAIMQNTLCADRDDDPLLRRFLLLQNQRDLQPKVIVAYERTPFVYDFGNVRITFDRNIGSTSELDSFFDENLMLRPVLPFGKHILEDKYDELLPDFLYDIMNLGSLQRTAFSKYYLCRKFTI